MSTLVQQVLSWFRFDNVRVERDESRYDAAEREMERRVAALDATTGAQLARQARERDDHARLEMLGINRQVLEERIAAEMQENRRARGEGNHAGMD